MKVNYSINTHDVEMLEIISGEKYPIYISLNKALAILGTNDNADAIEEVEKYNKRMYKIIYPNGKSFVVGIKKVGLVLDSEREILTALQSGIDHTEEA